MKFFIYQLKQWFWFLVAAAILIGIAHWGWSCICFFLDLPRGY